LRETVRIERALVAVVAILTQQLGQLAEPDALVAGQVGIRVVVLIPGRYKSLGSVDCSRFEWTTVLPRSLLSPQ